jgi:hypothetical protein
LYLLWLFICAGGVPVQAEAPSRAQLEAAYLYKFLPYVEWPAQSFESADSPFVIGILGSDPFGRALDDLVAGEKIKGRAIEVRHFTGVSHVGKCQVLFIGTSESARLPGILDKLRHRSILTVSELPDFARGGGMIGLVNQGNKIRFQINLDAAQQAEITISSKLMQLAQNVYSNKRP